MISLALIHASRCFFFFFSRVPAFFSFVLNSIEESFTVITKSSETKERAGKSCCLCYLDRTKLEQSRNVFVSLLL
jgi:hypothetical protein